MTTLPALIPPTTTGAIEAGIMSSQADTDHELVALWIGQSASRHTRRNYERQSARFLAFIGRPLASVRVGDVQAYLASLGDVAPATRANATAAIKSLFSFAQLTGFLRFNVGKVIKAAPVKNTLAERILPEAGTLRMIALETSPRNRALLTLIYGGGLRIAEACGLRWRDLSERDDDAGQVTLYGKGGKTRVVLVSANTWHLLSDIRGEAGPDDAVFRSRRGGGALDESAVHRVRQDRSRPRRAVSRSFGPLASARPRLACPRPRRADQPRSADARACERRHDRPLSSREAVRQLGTLSRRLTGTLPVNTGRVMSVGRVAGCLFPSILDRPLYSRARTLIGRASFRVAVL